MSLVRDPNGLAIVSHRHSRCSFLRANSPGLVFVLDESNSLSSRHQSGFDEPFEATKHGSKRLLVRIVGNIPQEQNLVRGKVFVWDNGRRCTSGRLETGTLGRLGWSGSIDRTGGTFEFLLSLEGFVGLFAFWWIP